MEAGVDEVPKFNKSPPAYSVAISNFERRWRLGEGSGISCSGVSCSNGLLTVEGGIGKASSRLGSECGMEKSGETIVVEGECPEEASDGAISMEGWEKGYVPLPSKMLVVALLMSNKKGGGISLTVANRLGSKC